MVTSFGWQNLLEFWVDTRKVCSVDQVLLVLVSDEVTRCLTSVEVQTGHTTGMVVIEHLPG